MRPILTALLLLLVVATSFAQAPHEGRDFWMGFMKNMNAAGQQPNQKISVSSQMATNVTVTAPVSGWTTTVFVPANGYVEISVPEAGTYVTGPTGIYGTGIHLVSDEDVTVTLFNNGFAASEDATLVYPMEYLGSDYIGVAWNDQFAESEMLAVATEDSTILEIAHINGVVDTVVINEGQTYRVLNVGGDITGTRMRTLCRNDGTIPPLAAFSGNTHTRVEIFSAYDHTMEQLQDVSTWGVDFLVPDIPCHPDFFLKIVARDNGTQVSVGGTNINLNSGNNAVVPTFADVHVASNNPVAVYVITYGGDVWQGPCDANPFMASVSPRDQAVERSYFHTYDNIIPGNTNFMYVNIMTEFGNTGNITLNGMPVAGWQGISGSGGGQYTSVPLPQGNTRHVIDGGGGTFTAIYQSHIHGVANGYGIGFAAPEDTFEIGYLGDTLPAQQWQDTLCACEPVTFVGPDPNVSYSWDFGDGTTAFGDTVTHFFANGTFEITMRIPDDEGCYRYSNQQTITVVNCDISVQPDEPVCPGEPVILTVTAPAATTFLWSNGATTSSITVTPDSTTVYSVQVNGGTLSLCDSVIVYVKPLPDFDLPEESVLCEGGEVTLSTGLPNEDHLWSTGATTDQITVNQTGTYSVTVDNGQCEKSDTTEVIVHPLPTPNNPEVVELCEEYDRTLDAGNAGSTYLWNTGETTQTIEATSPLDYSVTITTPEGCTLVEAFPTEECEVDLFIPNAITPNGDGANDVWEIGFLDNYPLHRVLIYNRNGQELLDAQPYGHDWDGTWQGQLLPAGAYYYVIDIGNDRVYKGAVHLILER